MAEMTDEECRRYNVNNDRGKLAMESLKLHYMPEAGRQIRPVILDFLTDFLHACPHLYKELPALCEEARRFYGLEGGKVERDGGAG